MPRIFPYARTPVFPFSLSLHVGSLRRRLNLFRFRATRLSQALSHTITTRPSTLHAIKNKNPLVLEDSPRALPPASRHDPYSRAHFITLSTKTVSHLNAPAVRSHAVFTHLVPSHCRGFWMVVWTVKVRAVAGCSPTLSLSLSLSSHHVSLSRSLHSAHLGLPLESAAFILPSRH